MQWLLKKLEDSKPLFEKGGKYEKLYPLYEAQDTILFTPADTTEGSTVAVRDALDIKRVMITVVIALVPCLLFGIFNAGRQSYLASGLEGSFLQYFLQGSILVLPIVMVSYVVGGLWEVLFSTIRGHEVNEGFLVTGLLFPLTLPPTMPLWQVAVGISFGVVIGKEIFGGTGFNFLNPALTARAFCFFAYPNQIIGEVWAAPKTGEFASGMTGATPLGVAFTSPPGDRETIINLLAENGFTLRSMFFGLENGSIGETAVIPVLMGLALLLFMGLASWRIIAGGLLGLLLTAFVVGLIPGDEVKSFVRIPITYHLVLGSFLFGLVFMATDPVSAAATDLGKWIYGFLIGALTITVRFFNPAYPEATMLAILFMNVMAPWVDHYVVQRHLRKREQTIRSFDHA